MFLEMLGLKNTYSLIMMLNFSLKIIFTPSETSPTFYEDSMNYSRHSTPTPYTPSQTVSCESHSSTTTSSSNVQVSIQETGTLISGSLTDRSQR